MCGLIPLLILITFSSGYGGETEQYGMYPSHRIKRRPAPYEIEINDDNGKSILDFNNYVYPHFALDIASNCQGAKGVSGQ